MSSLHPRGQVNEDEIKFYIFDFTCLPLRLLAECSARLPSHKAGCGGQAGKLWQAGILDLNHEDMGSAAEDFVPAAFARK